MSCCTRRARRRERVASSGKRGLEDRDAHWRMPHDDQGGSRAAWLARCLAPGDSLAAVPDPGGQVFDPSAGAARYRAVGSVVATRSGRIAAHELARSSCRTTGPWRSPGCSGSFWPIWQSGCSHVGALHTPARHVSVAAPHPPHAPIVRVAPASQGPAASGGAASVPPSLPADPALSPAPAAPLAPPAPAAPLEPAPPSWNAPAAPAAPLAPGMAPKVPNFAPPQAVKSRASVTRLVVRLMFRSFLESTRFVRARTGPRIALDGG